LKKVIKKFPGNIVFPNEAYNSRNIIYILFFIVFFSLNLKISFCKIIFNSSGA